MAAAPPAGAGDDDEDDEVVAVAAAAFNRSPAQVNERSNPDDRAASDPPENSILSQVEHAGSSKVSKRVERGLSDPHHHLFQANRE